MSFEQATSAPVHLSLRVSSTGVRRATECAGDAKQPGMLQGTLASFCQFALYFEISMLSVIAIHAPGTAAILNRGHADGLQGAADHVASCAACSVSE